LLGQQSLSPSKLSQEDMKNLATYDDAQEPTDTYTDTYENNDVL
jgi:cytochrome c553